MKKEVLLLFVLFLILVNLKITSPEHLVSPSSFSIGINKESPFTITINNTDSDNITEVNITLPSSLTFIYGSNSTDSSSFFTNTSDTLSWQNSSYVISSQNLGENVKSFSFNALSTSLGTFNITVKTTNSTNTIETNISLTIIDTENPTISLVSPADGIEDNDGIVVFECDATDNVGLDIITLYIWDSNNSEIYKNSVNINGTSNESSWNYTFASDGDYTWNCFVNDTSGNYDSGLNRTLKINTSDVTTENINETTPAGTGTKEMTHEKRNFLIILIIIGIIGIFIIFLILWLISKNKSKTPSQPSQPFNKPPYGSYPPRPGSPIPVQKQSPVSQYPQKLFK